MDETIPVVPAYLRNGSYCVWCEYCFVWHMHGPADGHRVAHCRDPRSPYKQHGYILDFQGEMTAAIERDHGQVPHVVSSLSTDHLKLWCAAYGLYKFGTNSPRQIKAWQLLRLFELNHLAEMIQGSHPLAKQTFLRWQLLRTPGVLVHPHRKLAPTFTSTGGSRPFLYSPQEIVSLEMPDDAQAALTWFYAQVVATPGAVLPLWQAWSDYRVWVRYKGEEYRVSQAEWLHRLTHETPLTVARHADWSGRVFLDHALREVREETVSA